MTTLFAADTPRPQSRPAPRRRPGRWWPLAWMTIASCLLAASGMVHAWQARQIESARSRVITPLFPLKELPTIVGKWKAVEGREVPLDPQIARLAGSVDSLIRSYCDENTGVVVTVLVLFGRTEGISHHTPEVCYPAVGYVADDDALDVAINAGSKPARFRSLVYKKAGGTETDRQEVFYAYRQDGNWSPAVSGNLRDHLQSEGIYKIQIQRGVTSKERRSSNNPTEQFLAAFLPELEKRIADAHDRAKPGPSTPPRRPGKPSVPEFAPRPLDSQSGRRDREPTTPDGGRIEAAIPPSLVDRLGPGSNRRVQRGGDPGQESGDARTAISTRLTAKTSRTAGNMYKANAAWTIRRSHRSLSRRPVLESSNRFFGGISHPSVSRHRQELRPESSREQNGSGITASVPTIATLRRRGGKGRRMTNHGADLSRLR